MSVADVPAVAVIWGQGWHDAHSGLVAPALELIRTPASFTARAMQRVEKTVVAVVDCEVVGFVTVIADEVEELFVERAVRGRGIAAALLHHAEAAIRAEGFIEGWLAVIAENTRARRFYEREGWVDRGPFEYQAQGADGPLLVPSHRYARPLGT